MANAVEMSTMRKLVAQLNQYRHEYYNLNAPSVADDPNRNYRNALNGGQPVRGLHDGCDRKGRALYPQRHQREDRIVGCCGRQFCNKKDRLSNLW